MCAGDGDAQALAHDQAEHFSVFDGFQAVTLGCEEFWIRVRNGGGADNEINFIVEEFTKLIARDAFARLASWMVCSFGLGSEPLTIVPPSSNMLARPLIPEPPMPIKWIRLPAKRLAERDSVRNSPTTDSTMGDILGPRI